MRVLWGRWDWRDSEAVRRTTIAAMRMLLQQLQSRHSEPFSKRAVGYRRRIERKFKLANRGPLQ